MRAVLVDTGPLVALLHEGDDHHRAAIAALTASASAGRALVTTWEVIGEAYTLIRTRLGTRQHVVPAMTVLDWASDGGALIEQSTDADQRGAIDLLRTHADLRLSYGDSLLLTIGRRLGVDEVLTIDAHLGAVDLGALVVTVV